MRVEGKSPVTASFTRVFYVRLYQRKKYIVTIFIKSSPYFIRCEKEFNWNSFFAIMRGEKSDRRI